LKALGLPLEEIRACLDAGVPSLAQVVERQVVRLRAIVVHQQELLMRLEHLAHRVAAGETIDTETLLNSIEASTIMEKYFSTEQMQTLKQRAEDLGRERIAAVEQAWPEVIAGMQAAVRLDKDPASSEVQALARRWRALVREFTGGDTGLQRSVATLFRAEPAAMQQRTGIDPALMAYAQKAIALLTD
jgi:DNA-binding transcriptional MerR regulator